MPMTERAQRVLDRLYEEDLAQRQAGLPSSQRSRNIDRESGRFLHLLTVAMAARSVFEIGSSNGVSTIWLGSAVAQTGGKVIGTEKLAQRAADATVNLEAAGLSEWATVVAGDAKETARSLAAEIDLVFIDAEKDDYSDHFLAIIDHVRPGGVIVADNVLSHDCSAYQLMLRNRDDVESVTMPLERGLEFTVKKGLK